MKKLVFPSVFVVVALIVACSKTPSSPSVSFTAPSASQPANGSSFKFVQQPVTLTITNAVRTSAATATYRVEVATDAAFTNKVYTKDSIPEGTGTTTSVTIDTLAGAPAGSTTYYWRSMATVEGVVGSPSTPQTFIVAPKVVLGAPSTINPAGGVTASTARPTFVTTNASATGSPGPVSYEFQVSTSSSFSSLVASATVPEQAAGQTSWTPTADLPVGTAFWRVRASDPSNSVVGGFSAATSFVVQPFDMSQAIMLDNPPDVGSWAQTAKITVADTAGEFVVVDFDKRTSPDKWPESGFGGGGIQYTLGMCLNITAKWYCSAVIQFWDGRELTAGGVTSNIGIDWYYDGRWGPMIGHQPAPGEIVGMFVAQGNLRDSGNTSVKERSNVVLMPYRSTYIAP